MLTNLAKNRDLEFPKSTAPKGSAESDAEYLARYNAYAKPEPGRKAPDPEKVVNFRDGNGMRVLAPAGYNEQLGAGNFEKQLPPSQIASKGNTWVSAGQGRRQGGGSGGGR